MKNITCIFGYIFLLCLIGVNTEGQLKIGVKKRVECTNKSKKWDTLTIHYTGTFKDGTIFDSSYEKNEPSTFTIGEHTVILGWERGLVNMCEGEKRRLVVPSELAYGPYGFEKVPPNATLIYEIDLIKLEVKNKEL